MNNLNILIIVDTLGAATSGDLGANVYLVDTNSFAGSTGEGGPELMSVVYPGQAVTWALFPVDPNASVSIYGFSGEMIDAKVCLAAATGPANSPFWAGMVNPYATIAEYQYSCTRTIDNKQYSWDPFPNVTQPA